MRVLIPFCTTTPAADEELGGELITWFVFYVAKARIKEAQGRKIFTQLAGKAGERTFDHLPLQLFPGRTAGHDEEPRPVSAARQLWKR